MSTIWLAHANKPMSDGKKAAKKIKPLLGLTEFSELKDYFKYSYENNIKNVGIENIITMYTRDLGTPGRDNYYGTDT